MAPVVRILEALQELAPAEFALSFDRVGLQIGRPEDHVTKALVSLDRSLEAVRLAIASGAQLLLCHHPLIWQPLSAIAGHSDAEIAVRELVTAGVAFVAAHTNWDAASGGVNDALAARLGLVDVRPFGTASEFDALKFVTFVPSRSLEAVVGAAAEAGAGLIGDYRRCAFASEGCGMFDAPADGHPAVGEAGKQNRVPEHRIEMELPTGHQAAVEAAVRGVHPYEEPVIDFYPLRKRGHPLGRVGRLAVPVSPGDFIGHCDRALRTHSMAWTGAVPMISTVAVVGGAADDEWRSALAAAADAFVTGEVKQHNAVEATAFGLTIVAAGHYATEQPGVESLVVAMRQLVPEVEWLLHTPAPGKGGRPLEGS